MAKIEVTGRRRILSPATTRQGKFDVLVLYQVDGDRNQTFFVTVPEEEANDVRIQQEIRKAEAERKPVAPMTFDL